MRYKITSLPLIHELLGLPTISTLMALGTLSQVSPEYIAAAISVEPIPVEKAPKAP